MEQIQVQAKVRLNEKADVFTGPGKITRVKFAAVYGDSKENKTWSRYTPSGSIELSIDNPAAVDAFELGAEYIVSFEKYVAPPPEVASKAVAEEPAAVAQAEGA